MPESIQWTLSVAVAGGPRKTESQTLPVDVYLKGQVQIAAASGATPGQANFAAPSGGGTVRFVLISASRYDATPPLTYTVDGGSAITLDGPHLLIGAGAVALLGTANLDFIFSNPTAQPVTVEVLIGRDAA